MIVYLAPISSEEGNFMRSLIAARSHEFFEIKAIILNLHPNRDFQFTDSSHEAISFVSQRSYELVAVDYDLGGLLFIQELIQNARNFKRLEIYNISGFGTVGSVEVLRRNFDIHTFPTTSEFLQTMKKYKTGA